MDDKRLCKKCGSAVQLEEVFCPYCGQKIDRESIPSDKRFCDYCRAENDSEALFCSACGKKLKTEDDDFLKEKKFSAPVTAIKNDTSWHRSNTQETGVGSEKVLNGNGMLSGVGRTCPECGASNDLNEIFCVSCGIRLGRDNISLPVTPETGKSPDCSADTVTEVEKDERELYDKEEIIADFGSSSDEKVQVEKMTEPLGCISEGNSARNESAEYATEEVRTVGVKKNSISRGKAFVAKDVDGKKSVGSVRKISPAANPESIEDKAQKQNPKSTHIPSVSKTQKQGAGEDPYDKYKSEREKNLSNESLHAATNPILNIVRRTLVICSFIVVASLLLVVLRHVSTNQEKAANVPRATATPRGDATFVIWTSTPTQQQTASPTPKPTVTSTPKPTATPTPKPTATSTPRPTATPTVKPTATPRVVQTNDAVLDRAIREKLDIYGRPLTQDDLLNVTELKIFGQVIVDTSILKCCENLETLILSDCGLDAVPDLRNAMRLEYLDLSGNDIRDIYSFPRLNSLNTLVLYGNPLSDISGLSSLSLDTNIYIADVSANQGSNHNDNTRQIQALLIESNYLYDSADGEYGPKTAAGIKALQSDAGLRQTGGVDQDTIRAIMVEKHTFQPIASKHCVIYNAHINAEGYLVFKVKNTGSEAIACLKISGQQLDSSKSSIGTLNGEVRDSSWRSNWTWSWQDDPLKSGSTQSCSVFLGDASLFSSTEYGRIWIDSFELESGAINVVKDNQETPKSFITFDMNNLGEREQGGYDDWRDFGKGDEEYIFPESSTRKLTKEEIRAVDKELWPYARNEIYARHGYKFTQAKFKNYFEDKSWYEPGGFSTKDLNDIEWYNMELIAWMEKNED